MKDILVTPADLGQAIRERRLTGGLKATDIARRSGRARNVLYRLEAGHDITVASLVDILRAMGLAIALQPLGMPTIDDMRRLFDENDDDSEEDSEDDKDSAAAKRPAPGRDGAA